MENKHGHNWSYFYFSFTSACELGTRSGNFAAYFYFLSWNWETKKKDVFCTDLRNHMCYILYIHCSDVKWTSGPLNLPASRLFFSIFRLVLKKNQSCASLAYFEGTPPTTDGLPSQRAMMTSSCICIPKVSHYQETFYDMTSYWLARFENPGRLIWT